MFESFFSPEVEYVIELRVRVKQSAKIKVFMYFLTMIRYFRVLHWICHYPVDSTYVSTG